MSLAEINNENDDGPLETMIQSGKGQNNNSSQKKLYNQLYQSAQFDAMPSYMTKSTTLATNNQQNQASNKALQDRLNKSGIFFKNGTLVNITDLDIDGTQRNEKDEKIRDLQDRETALKKQLREVQAKLEKDLAILNQKLEFAELELKEAKQKLKDNDEFFRLFEINDLRYQQHPIFKQKFAQLNEMHNQQIITKQREIDYLRQLLRQYNEPTLQSTDSLNSVLLSQTKQQGQTNPIFSSSQKQETFNNLDSGNQQFQDDQGQTPIKLNKKNQFDKNDYENIQNDDQYDGLEDKVKRASKQQNFTNDEIQYQSNELQILKEQLQQKISDCELLNQKVNSLEQDLVKYEEINNENEKNKKQVISLEEECKQLKINFEQNIMNMKQFAKDQEEYYKGQLKEKERMILEEENKYKNLENQQQELLERAKNEQTAYLQDQLNKIIQERETTIQEYYEQEYLNKLEFYEKKHAEILEENQKTFEEQMYAKEQQLLCEVQQQENIYEENLAMKQLEFDQKIQSYEQQLQIKQQELMNQNQQIQTGSSQKDQFQEQIEQMKQSIEHHLNENIQLKQALENELLKSKNLNNDNINEELKKQNEQQKTLILQLEQEIKKSSLNAELMYQQQIKELEEINQTYQIQNKELENQLNILTSKLNNLSLNSQSMENVKNSNENNTTSNSLKQISKRRNNSSLNEDTTDYDNEEMDSTTYQNNDDDSQINQRNETRITSLSNKINKQNDNLNGNNQSVSFNLSKICTNKSEQQIIIEQLQQQLQQQQELYNNQVENTQIETGKLQSHIKQLEQLLLENRDAYYKERTVLENNIQTLKSENQNIQIKLQNQQNQVIQEQEYEMKQNNEIRQQVKELTQACSLLEEQKNNLSNELQKLFEQQNKSKENDNLIISKTNQINEYKIRIEVLQKQLKEQEIYAKKAQSNFDLLEIEKNELVQQVNFMENQQQQTQEQIVQEYENELQSLQGQLQDQIQEFSEERQRFLDTIEQLQQSINFQNQKNSELIQQCEQIEQEEGAFEQQQELIRILEDKLRDQDNYISERENIYAVEMQKKEKNISDLLNQIHILEMNRKELMDEVEQEQERMIAQMQSQKASQVSQSQTDSLTSKQIIQALQKERDYLQNKITIIESQKESLNNDLEELKSKLSDQQNNEQEETVKRGAQNNNNSNNNDRNFGFISFKAGSNSAAQFSPAQNGFQGNNSSQNALQIHKRNNSITSNNYNSNNNNQGQNIPSNSSQNQILCQSGGSSSNMQIIPSYDNGQYLNTSQFGGAATSNYMSNSAINTMGNYPNQITTVQSHVLQPSSNSMAQSSVFSSGQSFVQYNHSNNIIFGSVNHSSLYGLSQAQMLEIIERAYTDRLQQQQLYFEQKFKKEREENLKRSKEPTLIAEKKKLQQENEKLNKEMQQLRTQKQLEDEFSSIKGREYQILKETAKLCDEKSRSKNRPTRDNTKNNIDESDRLKDKFLSNDKKGLLDLSSYKQKGQLDEEKLLSGWDKQQKVYENKIKNIQDSNLQNSQLDISSYFSPNKQLTEGDARKKNKNSTILNNPNTNSTSITSITTITTTTSNNNNNNNNNNLTNMNRNSEAGSIIVTRNKTKKQLGQPLVQSNIANQNIAPIIQNSITSSISSELNYSKQNPISQSLLLNNQGQINQQQQQYNNNNNNNKVLEKSSNSSQNNNNNNCYTRAYGAKDSTLISINSNNSDVFRSNIFNSNNNSTSFLKNSNLNESYIKNTSNHINSQNNCNLMKNSNTNLFPHRDSTPTTILKKSYINFDEPSQLLTNNHNSNNNNLNISSTSQNINGRMQRSITENKLFHPNKLNFNQQKY